MDIFKSVASAKLPAELREKWYTFFLLMANMAETDWNLVCEDRAYKACTTIERLLQAVLHPKTVLNDIIKEFEEDEVGLYYVIVLLSQIKSGYEQENDRVKKGRWKAISEEHKNLLQEVVESFFFHRYI